PSGSGKTTLLHILAGILKPDGGRISKPDTVSVMFQEDRLCEDYSAVKNVELVCGDRSRAAEALAKLLEPEALEKPCGQLSGGMKRRVALVRAMEADSAFVLLDEPFTGMDEQPRSRAMEYIRRRQNGRTLIIATHIS
ncbi:MAG: ATP-binding cassette domain-containing protein, partial [Acetatifactor sp.]|nr:ATP-binding cassette domain-containing protein [Acetatifactor sp.]